MIEPLLKLLIIIGIAFLPSALFSFITLGIQGGCFWLIEKLLPVRKNPKFNFSARRLDLYYGVVTPAILMTAGYFAFSFSQDLAQYYGEKTTWYLVRFFAAFMVAELGAYWAHRLSHKVPLLWKYHRVHHESEHMDWLASHRHHYFDALWLFVGMNVPILILGLPFSASISIPILHRFYTVFLHSNVNANFGIWLASPHFHHWHHAEPDREGKVYNFSNSLPWLDKILGTYHAPAQSFPENYGLGEELRSEDKAA